MRKDNYTEKELADYLGIKPATLRVMRHRGQGPKFYRLTNTSHGRVRYRDEDVQLFREQNLRSSTK